MDRTAHHIHNVFCDGHSQAGACHLAQTVILCPLKRIEDTFYKVRFHSDAVVFHLEYNIDHPVIPLFFLEPDRDLSALRRVFHSV